MADRPNVLVLMADQHRADCLGAAGHPTVTTPNLDRLADEGTRFSHLHTSCPICMPARSSFASGTYCHNHGQWTNRGCLPPDADTYMRRFQSAGYHTVHIGKSHLHGHSGKHLSESVPYMNALGFEDVLESTGPWATTFTDSIMTDHWQGKGLVDVFRDDYRKRQEMRRSGEGEAVWPSPMPEGETLDDFVGRTAVEYLQACADARPFCTFVGFGGPHEPWDPPVTWAQRYADADPGVPIPRSELPDWLSAAARDYEEAIAGVSRPPERAAAIRRLYYAKISHIDSWIGRILGTLEERGELENTIILYWSDHGERLCDRDGLYKQVFFDESVRVPLILRRPGGRGRGAVASTLCETIDLMPTLLDAAGLPVEGCLGKSLLGATEDPAARLRDAVFSEIDHVGVRGTMIRTEAFKMVVDEHAQALQLFDIRADPQEGTNLANREDMGAEEGRLREAILRWRLATDRPQ